jgi:hypothetical protein
VSVSYTRHFHAIRDPWKSLESIEEYRRSHDAEAERISEVYL